MKMIKQPQAEEVPSALLCLECISLFTYVDMKNIGARDVQIDQCPLCECTGYCSTNWQPKTEEEVKPMDKFDKTEFGVMIGVLSFLAGCARMYFLGWGR